MKILKQIVYRLTLFLGKNLIYLIKIPFAQNSLMVPTESWTSFSNDQLIDINLAVALHARSIDHSDIASKMIACPFWQIILPGEHHRLLSGLIIELRPKVVIEIGTATGYFALAIKKFLSPDGNLYSLGIVSWRQFPNYILQESDFVDHRFEQISADLKNPVMFQLIRSYTQMLISFSLMQPKTVFRKNFY